VFECIFADNVEDEDIALGVQDEQQLSNGSKLLYAILACLHRIFDIELHHPDLFVRRHAVSIRASLKICDRAVIIPHPQFFVRWK
jgi:hypothetical protein